MSAFEKMYVKTIDEPPGEFTVISRSAPIKPHGHRVWGRVGNYSTLEEARQGIVKDIEYLKDTMGGLFTPISPKGREYAIWKATWERIPL
jgi:hypothetical protein